jgi:hypothetical protein
MRLPHASFQINFANSARLLQATQINPPSARVRCGKARNEKPGTAVASGPDCALVAYPGEAV